MEHRRPTKGDDQSPSLEVVHLVDAAGGSHYLWGKEQVVLSLMKAQRSSGAITPRLVTFSTGRLSEEAAAAGFAVHTLYEKHHSLSLLAVPRLIRLVRRMDRPLLHTHGYKANIIGRLAARIGAPISALVSTCHGWIESSLKLRFYNMLDRYTSLAGDVLVVPDKKMIQRLPRATRVLVIPNGVPDRSIPSPELRRRAKQKFGWGENQFVVGMLGRIAGEKGIDELLAAVALSRHANTVWAVAGAGESTAELRRCRSRSLHFVGYISPSEEYLAALDAFIQPSRTEGLSLALIEAARSGLPIIATSVGGTATAFRHGEEALLIDPYDPVALEEAVAKLSEEPEVARRLGMGARKRFEEQYKIEAMSSAYSALYRTAILR